MFLADLPNPAQRTTRYFYGGESQWRVCEEQVPDSEPPFTNRTTATYVYGGWPRSYSTWGHDFDPK
jgi:hypothetical protein